ncbi:hypothetical protein BCR35DRAFT_355241 [Leucosporidium creatinivorum]|uniref:NAD(P)-binding protein n=1 Tax=Leucosporidium creatinivorum TaxID=106004 RepID=A0A1Y2DMC3_9BASI|nr:hypothetical protein BCR35DRAFT_355241 [Leucosporidium creatinivorum]
MPAPHPALAQGNTAVVTGAGGGAGIGYAIALQLLQRYGLKVLLSDLSTDALERTSEALVKAGVDSAAFFTHAADVSQWEEVKELSNVAFEKLGRVDFLILNAGVQRPTKDFTEISSADDQLAAWNQTLGVNFYGVLHGTQAFTDRMVAQSTPAAIVVTGSKQGITQPPGNPAYNVSKSAVKSLTESLAHSLIPTSVSAHLLVPGYTYTKLTAGGNDFDHANKPAAAWTSDQVAEELFARLDEFYIICPDNDVNWALDSARMEWNANDILKKRPALSRWHPEYEKEFAEFVKSKTAAK